jgi:hypothetical protein
VVDLGNKLDQDARSCIEKGKFKAKIKGKIGTE